MDDSSGAEVMTARAADPMDLSDRLVGKLRGANKRLVVWLASDAENRRLFLERPVTALVEAGVDLTHGEKQTLIRAHQMRRGASDARRLERPRV
jgi:hypothetical protein